MFFANVESHWGTPRGLDLNIWAPSIARDERAIKEVAAEMGDVTALNAITSDDPQQENALR